MARRALVLFAPGFEEIETVTVVDVLRRAGVEVVLAGTAGGPLEGGHGIALLPDAQVAQVSAGDFDAVILPGGMQNARTLAGDARVQRILAEARAAEQVVGAICAAPIALVASGLLEGRRLTSHPGVEAELPRSHYSSDRVVVDGRLVTSRGPGTALEFALALVEVLVGPEQARAIAAGMLARPA